MSYGKPQLEFLNKKHYLNGKTMPERFDVIHSKIREYEPQYSLGLADRFRGYIEEQIVSMATPQWPNFGLEKKEGGSTPLSASCYIVAPENTIQGIYYSIGETAMMSKLGGGVGANFSKISDKGTKLENGMFTNSKLDWVEDLVRASQKVSQGGTRKGYSVPFISIDDGEFWDLIERADKKNPDKKDPLVSNNVGIILPKGFRQRMAAGDKEAKKRYLKCLSIRQATGKLYLLDIENCNKNQSPVYEILGQEVDSTNICCVAGDQLVATKYGFKKVVDLSEMESLELFDNEKVCESTGLILRREEDDVFEITLKNGMTHKITKDHEVLVYDTTTMIKYKKSIEEGLAVGDKVCVQTNKGMFGPEHNPELAFVLGLFIGDGSEVNKNRTRISLWENDFDLIDEVENIVKDFYRQHDKHFNQIEPEFKEVNTGDSLVRRKNIETVAFGNNGFEFRKNKLPAWVLEGTEATHWQLLRGLLYSDGTVGDYNTGKSYGQPVSVSLTSINLDLLKQVQLICVNLGLGAKIYDGSPAKMQLLPKNDGSGEYKEYNCKKSWRLIISNKNDLLKLDKHTEFLKRKGVTIVDREYRDNSQKASSIVSIEYAGREPVYCPTVNSEEHLWVCNGFITSNCEITTPTYEDKSFVCVICSLNLVHWDRIKADPQIIKDTLMYLDICVSEFIKLTEGIPFMEKARRSAIEKRDIGLGTMGLHEYLQSKDCAFGDLESRWINKDIYSTIKKYADEYAFEIGEKLGSPKLCQDAGLVRRNVSLLAIAPNKSSSFIMGGTSLGIEPFFSNYFVKSLAGIEWTFKSKKLTEYLDKYEKNTPEVWESVLKNLGSAQHLDFLSPKEKSVVKTASEISPKDIIDLAADRQEFIDMGQSLNMWNRPNYTIQDVYNIHKYAFDRGIKTLYYFFSQGHAAIEKDGEKWDACESCAD